MTFKYRFYDEILFVAFYIIGQYVLGEWGLDGALWSIINGMILGVSIYNFQSHFPTKYYYDNGTLIWSKFSETIVINLDDVKYIVKSTSSKNPDRKICTKEYLLYLDKKWIKINKRAKNRQGQSIIQFLIETHHIEIRHQRSVFIRLESIDGLE